jgi:hypothetical protein
MVSLYLVLFCRPNIYKIDTVRAKVSHPQEFENACIDFEAVNVRSEERERIL